MRTADFPARAAAERDVAVAVPAVGAAADDLRPTGSQTDDTAGRPEPPLEADPADVAEQDAAVPYDDEDR